MSVKRRGAAQGDVEDHVNRPWHLVHGIWPYIRPDVMVAPAFRAYRTTSDQTITQVSTEVLVQLNAESFDNAGAYDPTTLYRWTCKKTGIYAWDAGVQVNNNSGGAANIFVRLRIGGSSGTLFLSVLQEYSVPNGTTVMRCNSTKYPFTIDQYVEMYCWTTGQPVSIIQNGVFASFMDAAWVGLLS